MSINKEDNKPEIPKLNLPPVDLKIRQEGNLVKVFDPLRDKYVHLTPEEFVRQHFVPFLINQLHYPPTLMANEITINLNDTRKRCDTVVFNSDGTPLIIVEYKAPGVVINQNVFNQIVRYNMRLKARYLIVSNGFNHYCCKIDYSSNSYNFLPRIPDYQSAGNIFSEN